MQILTTQEVAEWLKVDIRTIQRQAQTKYYPAKVCSKIGRQYRFIKEELEKFLFPQTAEN